MVEEVVMTGLVEDLIDEVLPFDDGGGVELITAGDMVGVEYGFGDGNDWCQ